MRQRVGLISSPSTRKIAIIGAGPGGLTLAALLGRHQLPCAVYELESGPNERNQGGTLDLHPESGQLALREAGLIDQFKKKARPEGEALKLVTPTGQILWDESAGDTTVEHGGRPEIDRLDLRNMLLDAVEPEAIRWGQKLQSVEPAGNNQYDLHFAGGLVEKGFDLVVGADGAWSRVRPLLTDAKPFYSGVTLIELWALDVETRKPWLSRYVGAGSCFMFDEGRALLCQRNGNGSIRTYACVRQPEHWIRDSRIDWTQPEAARRDLVDGYFGDCGGDLKRAIMESDDELIPRPLYMLPVGIKWAPRPGLTLLGDAAHLMTVFAGVGVNVAMHDAHDLAAALIGAREPDSTPPTLADALLRYERAMFERAHANAQDTWNQMQSCFRANGGQAMIDMMTGGGGPDG